MWRLSFFIFFFITNLYAQDYGDGSDGACTFTGLQAKATWNCTDITVTGATTFPGTTTVVIKAQGTVTIQGAASLNLNGQTLTAGPGGSDGGDCNIAQCDSINGQGAGAGAGGGSGDDAGFNGGSGGGGGAGGTYNSLGVSGITGLTAAGSTAGVGGSAATASYGSEALFTTTMPGGSGGGAGGSGDQGGGSFAGTEGGDGGGGGGAIKIVAQGAIIIDGSVTANGGPGAAGNAGAEGTGAGGGGGSGGAIYLYSSQDITVNGSISAQGGVAGAGGDGGNTYKGGNGGVGGAGRIRLDSASGSYLGSGSVTPTPYQVATSAAAEYTSDIAFGCVYKEQSEQTNFILTFLLGLILVFAFRLLGHNRDKI